MCKIFKDYNIMFHLRASSSKRKPNKGKKNKKNKRKNNKRNESKSRSDEDSYIDKSELITIESLEEGKQYNTKGFDNYSLWSGSEAGSESQSETERKHQEEKAETKVTVDPKHDVITKILNQFTKHFF